MHTCFFVVVGFLLSHSINILCAVKHHSIVHSPSNLYIKMDNGKAGKILQILQEANYSRFLTTHSSLVKFTGANFHLQSVCCSKISGWRGI